MKKFSCTLLMVFSTTLLASCNGGGSSEEFKPSLDPETSCTIKIDGDYEHFTEIQHRGTDFNAYYPNVKIEYTCVSQKDYQNMIATVLEGKDKPNLFFASTWMLENEKYAPIVAHMENLSDPALKMNLSCIRPGLINKDNTLMVPLFGRSYGMLVNNDLFTKEELSIPNSWNDLLNVCKAFRAKGYENPLMGFSLEAANSLMNTVAYPAAVASLAKDPNAIKLANELSPSAGEYFRNAFNAVDQLYKNNCYNLEQCKTVIKNNYDAVIMTFFEGKVPMMICADDTPSGTKKRETRSDAFTNNPFSYSYAPIPLTDKGGYFIDNPSKLLAVNKDCDNLDMTNEFMRFLISTKELNALAAEKVLMSSTKEISFDSIYAPFSKVSADYTYSPEGLGISDAVKTQVRKAAYKIGKGEITVDEAIAQYGSF